MTINSQKAAPSPPKAGRQGEDMECSIELCCALFCLGKKKNDNNNRGRGEARKKLLNTIVFL